MTVALYSCTLGTCADHVIEKNNSRHLSLPLAKCVVRFLNISKSHISYVAFNNCDQDVSLIYMTQIELYAICQHAAYVAP